MTTTPILGITQVAPNQSGKEAVINTAILALEAATNGTLTVPVTTADATLSQSQFLSAILFKVTGLTADRTLNIPTQINGVNTQRVFSVRNTSTFNLTVKVNGVAGTTVIIPAGQTRLMDVDGVNNIGILAQNGQNLLTGGFTALTDAPQSYTGQALKIPQVKSTQDGLQFVALAVASLGDVDVATVAPTNGQALVWNTASLNWKPGTATLPPIALSSLSDLNISAPSNGQVLTYNTSTSKWIAATVAVASLATLSDATITTPANNQVLTYSSSAGKWINAAAAAGVTSLSALTDVNISAPGNGQVLTYSTSTSKWIAATIAAASVATLSDALITAPATGQVLTYDAVQAKWVNLAPAAGGGGGGGSGSGGGANRGAWGLVSAAGGTKTFPTVVNPYVMPQGWSSNIPMEVLADADAGIGTANALSFSAGGFNANWQLTIAFTTTVSGPFTIRFKTQGEINYDGTTINMDGVDVISRKQNDTSYFEYSQTMGVGSHTMVLRYTSDGGVTGGYNDVHISEIIIPAPASATPYAFGDVVTYQGRKWECLVAGTAVAPSLTTPDWVVIGTVTLAALSDVDETSVAPVDGQALVYSSTAGKWKPGTVASGGGAATPVMPTIRSRNMVLYNASTVNVAFPAGTVVGDYVVVFVTNGYSMNAAPAGWTTLDFQNGGYSNGTAILKVMTASDITTGYVTMTASGSYNGVAAAITIDGTTTSGMRDHNGFATGNVSYATYTVTGEALAKPTDLLIGFSYSRGDNLITISNFLQLEQAHGASASGFLGKFIGTKVDGTDIAETGNYPGGNNGLYFSLVSFAPAVAAAAGSITGTARVSARYWRARGQLMATTGTSYANQQGWGASRAAFKAGTTVLSTGGTPIGSNPQAVSGTTTSPAQAFDGAGGSFHGWYSGGTDSIGQGGLNSWVGYDFGTAVAPTTFEFAPLDGYTWMMPREVAIEYSTDGVSWKSLCSQKMSSPGVDGVVQIVTIPEATIAVASSSADAKSVIQPLFASCSYNVNTSTIVGSYNIASVTKLGTALYKFTFATPATSDNAYIPNCTGRYNIQGGAASIQFVLERDTATVGAAGPNTAAYCIMKGVPSTYDADVIYFSALLATPDVISVGGGSGGGAGVPVLIGTVTTVAGQTSVDFANIPATYRHLQLRATHGNVSTNASVTNLLGVRFNNDAGPNYNYNSGEVYGNGSTYATTVAGAAFASPALNPSMGVAGVPFGSCVIDINDYLSSLSKWVVGRGGMVQSNVGTISTIGSGYSTNNAAINRLTLVDSGGLAFATGSVFYLYGMSDNSGGNSGKPWYFKPPLAANFNTTYASFRGGSAANAVVLLNDPDVGLIASDPSADSIAVKPYGRPIPPVFVGASFTITAHLLTNSMNANDQIGLWARCNANQYVFFNLFNRGGSMNIQRAYYNSAWDDGSYTLSWMDQEIWMRIVISAQTTTYYLSKDGKAWLQCYATENLFTANYTDYGLTVSRYGATTPFSLTCDSFTSNEYP